MNIITSKDNPKVKLLKSLLTNKGREKNRLFLVEGPERVQQALEKGKLKLLAITSSGQEEYQRIGKGAESAGAQTFIFPDEFLDYLTDTVTPPGIMGACSLTVAGVDEVLQSPQVFLLEKIRDPGNLGTIMRTAAAADVGLLIAAESVDPFNPKVVRSGAGAHFDLLWSGNVDAQNILDKVKRDGRLIVGTAPSNGTRLDKIDFSKPCLVALGSERAGLSDRILDQCDEIANIPLQKIESLNLAISAGIIMYEIKRQSL